MRPQFIVRSRAPLSAVLLLIAFNFALSTYAAETIQVRIDHPTVISTIPPVLLGVGHENYDAYHAAYREFKAAIRQRLPQAVFSGPDSASNVSFVERFVSDEASDMSTATYHYYRTGARNREATLEFLLKRDDAFDQRLDR